MAKIIGNTTATPNPQANWTQTDETKADYIKNKPEILSREELVQVVIEALSQYNGEGGTNSFFGQKMYSFGVLSDIHLTDEGGRKGYNFKEGVDDFNRAIPALQKLGAEFVCISGDIGYDSRVQELDLFQKAVADYKDTMPFYACTGNHDWSHDDTNWNNYVGHPLNYVFTHKGDVFIFMSENQSSENAKNLMTPYGTDCIDWLKKQFDDYKGARIFVFMHYPLYPYAGLRDNTNYGFDPNSTEDDAILNAALATKNVVIFSGHTHYKFDCEEKYDAINTYNFQHNRVTLAHVPSCAYPRDNNHGEVPAASEGYIVEVYEKGFVLRGVNLVIGEYMTDYEYAYPADNNPVVADSASIVLGTNSVVLESKESIEVKVSLSKPADITVNVAKDNDYITVTPTSLEFSKDDADDYKTITITAGNIDADTMSVITLSADGLTSKSISVTLKDNEEEEPDVPVDPDPDEPDEPDVSGGVEFIDGVVGYTPKDGDVFTGTVANHQITTKTVTSKDNDGDGKVDDIIYNLTFSDFQLSNTNTPVYFYHANTATDYTDVVTINLVGDKNSITCDAKATVSQRIMSSSATVANKLIGVGDGAKLTLTSSAANIPIKGDYIITNADIVLNYNGSATDYVQPVATSGNTGITISGSGSFSVNEAKVSVLECEGGTLTVNLGKATPGVSDITIEATPHEGYEFINSKFTFNNAPIDAKNIMPNVGETLIIEGVFSKT